MRSHFLRPWFGGRSRIWWLTHREQFRLVLSVCALVLCLGLVGRWDYEDQVAMERSRADKAEASLNAVHPLPPTTFIIEARTPAEAREKLADLAGQLDMQRAALKGAK